MDIQLDLDIHGSYPPSTSSWMWSVLSMDIQLDIHPLPSLASLVAITLIYILLQSITLLYMSIWTNPVLLKRYSK
jgi:hypothetical protein